MRARPPRGSRNDRIRQRREPLDLDRHLVSRLEQPLRIAEDADPGGCPGEDEVARLERRRLRRVRDHVVDPEDEIRRRRVLQRLAADDRADCERMRIGDLVARRHLANGAEGVGGLPARPLPVRELQVARAHVVRAEVSAHRLERVFLRHALDSRADHDAELGLVVGLGHDRRDDDRLARADQGRRPLREEERLRRKLRALLLGVVGVVQADADDLSRTLDRQHGRNLLRSQRWRVRYHGPVGGEADLRHAALDSIV